MVFYCRLSKTVAEFVEKLDYFIGLRMDVWCQRCTGVGEQKAAIVRCRIRARINARPVRL
jgi:hypothetical protein